MFQFQGRNYGHPVALLEQDKPLQWEFTPLTPAEQAAIPWAQVTATTPNNPNGFFADQSLCVYFPQTNLSPRFPRQSNAWLHPSDPPRELAVCMALHPRLGAASPLWALEDLTVRTMVLKSLERD